MAAQQLHEEDKIVRQLIAGDESAFELLYHSYKRPLAINLLRLLKSEELAEEVLQDLFIRIWDKRHQIDPDKSFSSFLFTVAKNMVYDLFRKSARDERLTAYLMANSSELYSHVEEQLFKKENEQLLYATLDKLPPQRRRVFMLFKIEEKSYKEISEELGISKATINEHITKANRFLKEQLSLPSSVISTTLLAGIILLQIK